MVADLERAVLSQEQQNKIRRTIKDPQKRQSALKEASNGAKSEVNSSEMLGKQLLKRNDYRYQLVLRGAMSSVARHRYQLVLRGAMLSVARHRFQLALRGAMLNVARHRYQLVLRGAMSSVARHRYQLALRGAMLTVVRLDSVI